MSEKIQTPFTSEQARLLNEYQQLGIYHPFTCCSSGPEDKCERRLRTGEGLLIATEEGWVCPCGEYKQNWAHSFMVKIEEIKKSHEEFLKSLF